MKRLFAVLLVAALVMGGAFAQLSFNAQVAADLWGTDGFQFSPQMAASKAAANIWGMDDSATLFSLGYSTDKAGVTVDIRPDATSDGPGSGATGGALHIHHYSGWFKPIDMLKISLGTNVAVSGFGAESIRWNCLGARAGEVVGAAVELTPVDGLYIGYVLNQCGEDIDKAKMGAAASYAIDGIGKFGVQWTTGNSGIDGKIMALGVGADLALVDGMTISPVYTIALDNNDVGLDPMHKIDLWFAWGNGPFSVKLLERALVRTFDLEGVDNVNNFGNIVKAEVNYAVTDTVSVNLKAAWGMNIHDAGDAGVDGWLGDAAGNSDWSGMHYWTAVGSGNMFAVNLSIPIAFDAGVTVQPGFLLTYDTELDDDAAKWAIPLVLKYSF